MENKGRYLKTEGCIVYFVKGQPIRCFVSRILLDIPLKSKYIIRFA